MSVFKLFSAIVLSMSVAFTAQAENKKKELTIGIGQEVSTLNPLTSIMLATEYVRSAVVRTLNVINDKNEWEPQLATKIPTFDNGLAKIVGKGKNKRIVSQWEIKANAKWGDGTPVTGHDVVFSRTVALHPKVGIARKQIYEAVEKIVVDKNNPKKFTMYHKEISADYNRLGDFYIVPKHLEQTPFNKYKEQAEGYANNSLYSKDPTNPGLYNGPFKITEFKLGSHITLSKNPSFYGTPAKIDTVIVKLVPNTATLEANLRSGTIDMISIIGLSFDQALALDKKVQREKLTYKVHFQPSLTYEHIDLNPEKNPALQNKNVRKALLHAINRDALTKALFEGKQPKALHFAAPSDPYYTDDKTKFTYYDYNPKKAKDLLEKAGYTMGPDKYLQKDGKRLSIQIMSTAGNKVRELVQVFIQNELKKVGVELTVKNEPARVFFGETVPKRKFEGMAMYAFTTLPEENLRPYLHSTSIPTKKNGFSGTNFAGWSNKKADTLIEQMEAEFDSQKRKNLAQEIMALYTEEVPVLPLYYRANISVTPKGLKGYRTTAHKYTSTNHIEDWELQ